MGRLYLSQRFFSFDSGSKKVLIYFFFFSFFCCMCMHLHDFCPNHTFYMLILNNVRVKCMQVLCV